MERVVAGELADGAGLRRGADAAVEADAHHEVLVLQDAVVLAGELAAQVLLALGVQAEPLKARVEVLAVDGVEAALGVDVDHALLDVQDRGLLLNLLVVVQRRGAVDKPLPFRLLRACPGLSGCAHLPSLTRQLCTHPGGPELLLANSAGLLGLKQPDYRKCRLMP